MEPCAPCLNKRMPSVKEVTGSSFILKFRGGWNSVVASEGSAKWIEYAVIERL